MKTVAEYLGRIPIGSPEWVEARRHGLGGSEIASVVGLSPWKSAYTLWYEKAGQIVPEQAESPYMWWGNAVEDVIAERWKQEAPNRFLRKTGMWRNLADPVIFADPDRFIVPSPCSPKATGILEIKTTSTMNAWQWGPHGGNHQDIPPYYLTQVQWYLACFQLPYACLAVVIGNGDYREYHIDADQETQDWLISAGTEFVQSIADGTPPDPDSSDSTYQAIRELHPNINPDLECEIGIQLASEFLDTNTEYKQAESDWKLVRTKIADLMGDAKEATCNGTVFATRRPGPGGSNPYVTPKPRITPEHLLPAPAEGETSE
jgi:putative phage-type endonuclease